MFKGLLLALALTLSAASVDYRVYACTSDNKTVTTYFTVEDADLKKTPSLFKGLEKAFRRAASETDAETFMDIEGLFKFLSYLTPTEREALEQHGIAAPHILAEKCFEEFR
jgi:hypothetical protein